MVRIMSLNVRGLRDNCKRREMFLYCKKKADIVCLQETHSTPQDYAFWRNEWRGTCFFSHGTSKQAGVFIGIRPGFPVSVDKFELGNNGRTIILQCRYEGQLFRLATLYAPNKDDPTFFAQFFKKLEDFDGHRIIVGDFNLTLNPQLDRKTTRKLSCNNDISKELVISYMEDSLLTDIWREWHPELLHYTWKQTKPFVASRIDMFLVDNALASWVKNTEICPGYKSDHSIVKLELLINNIERGKGIWKFNDKLLTDEVFVKGVNTILETCKKLGEKCNPHDKWEATKVELIEYSQKYAKQRAQDKKLIINQLELALAKLEKQMVEDPQDSTIRLHHKTKVDLENLVAEKTRAAIFRSKCQYYNEGEKNSKYFYNLEKNRSASKNMNTLIKEDGSIETDIVKILQEQHKFYSDLYRSDKEIKFECDQLGIVKVSENSKTEMDSALTLEELTKALKSSKRSSSPGSDGLTVNFFIMFWKFLGPELLEVTEYSFEKGKLFPSGLKGIIITIPKKSDVRFLRNLRPISLLNTDFKIIEKSIASRMKPVLMEIIHKDQKGFLPNRKISTNIRCILDIMDHLDRKDETGIVISVDYLKCFDRIEHESLFGAMKAFNFGENMIKWAKIFYNGGTSQVINNGHLSREIPLTRGCKQGSPGSPYYFLICAEILAIQLRNNTNIEGFKIKDFTKLFGQYADDMDLYCKDTEKNISEISRTLSAFCNTSGLKVNYDKTTIYRIGSCKESEAKKYCTKMRIETEKINVLGIWISKRNVMELNYDPLITKIKGIFQSWSNRQLSLFGKINVINTLIASQFVYRMTVLPSITKEFIKTFEKLCSGFIWNGRRAKIPIEKLQNSKYAGGAGLVNLEVKDNSLKVGWIADLESDEFMYEMALESLKPIGILRKNLWECNINTEDITATVQDNFWRDVLIAWSKLHFRQEVEACHISKQIIWFHSSIRVQKKPILWKKPHRRGLLTVGQLIENGKWIEIQIIKERYDLTTMQYNTLISAIPTKWKEMSVNCAQNPVSTYQSFIKHPRMSNYYYRTMITQTDLMYNTFVRWEFRLKENLEYEEFIKKLRNIKTITNNPKLRSFQYRLLNFAIITNIQLQKWKIKPSNVCTLCGLESESIEHLFFYCQYASVLLSEVKKMVAEYHKEETTLDINVTTVLFNEIHKKPAHLANFILLVAKYLIYSCKCLGKTPKKFELIEKVETFRRYEFYAAKMNNKLKQYYRKWENVIEIQKDEDLAHEYIIDKIIEDNM